MLMNDHIHILLIEDEEYDVTRVRRTIAPFTENIHIDKVVAEGQEALTWLNVNSNRVDVVIMDFQIAGALNGEMLIRRIKEVRPELQIIVITKMTVNISDFDFANRLLEAGAMWYCTKYPGDIESYIYQPTDFILSILNAYHKKKLEQDKNQSRRKLVDNINQKLQDKPFIGASAAIEKLRQQVRKVADSDSNVLIYGESGTGKELVANHIHYLSSRKLEQLVTINCGSLPNDLIESELFGYERGAFTGAQKQKAGLFEIADKGSIFLDEIGELPLNAQVKLLRVLQEGELDKIGRTERIRVDTRVIAATNRQLRQLVEQKSFREDLFYRLNVITIQIPPLRERAEDIPAYLNFFMKKFSTSMKVAVPEITSRGLNYLMNYHWPGNIRQLQNVIQRLLFMTEALVDEEQVVEALGTVITSRQPGNFGLPQTAAEIREWKETEKTYRKAYFQKVRSLAGSDAEAARMLGLAPPNFHRMCRELGMK